MKRIVTLFAVALLCSTPAFAVGNANNPAGGKQGGGTQKATSVNTITNSNIIANEKSKVGVGEISNSGKGNQDATSVNTLTNSTVIANDNSEVGIGTIKNQE